MKEYEVIITETLQKNIVVEADSREEAESVAEQKWRNSEYILDAEAFTGVTFTCVSGIQTHKELWKSVHDFECQLDIPPDACLVEMNRYGLPQWEAKDTVTPDQIEKAYAYLREFVSERSPNSVNIGAIDNLCTVYPEQAVYAVLTQSEKQGLIDYVEQVLDLSYHPSATEYHLYQMAVQEKGESLEHKKQPMTKSKQPDILR